VEKVASLAHIALKQLRGLLGATAVIRDEQLAAGLEPFLRDLRFSTAYADAHTRNFLKRAALSWMCRMVSRLRGEPRHNNNEWH
jgi:hypothetical protein